MTEFQPRPAASRIRSLGAALLAATMLAAPLSLAASAPAHAANAALPSFADLVERVSPAVVTITAGNKEAAPRMERLPPELGEMLRRFGVPDQLPPGMPGGPRGPRARALGSGFVVDPAGFIVTNRHVIEDADDIKVSFQDGKELSATLVGQDDRTDLAVLKVESQKPLPALAFGDSDKTRVGDWVVAVGNPFGLGGTVTAGIISARGREIGPGPYDDFLQIDASINRGNSGGPTFNADGQVIGINTAIFSPNGGSVGIGFAIPANLAKPIIEQLKSGGKVDRGWLGVSLQAVTPELADGLGLKEPKGALINTVAPKSPAEKAGLKPGDVVLKANGKDVASTRDLARVVGSVPSNTKVDLSLWRGGKAETVAVTVGQQPGQPAQVAAATGTPEAKGQAAHGLELSALDETWRQRLGIEEGVTGVVVSGTEDAVENVREGDVIASVNNEPVSSPADVVSRLEQAKKDGRKTALLLVRRGPQTAFVALPLKA
ncbi:MAG TPA: Do family serine endopeptidase [Azospirillaceae bacterium]|nr:Do family serine endopeptidase [Azospirillaceae bacterium]